MCLLDERKRKPNLSAKYSLEMGFSFHTHLGENLSIWRNAVMNQDIDCAGVVDGKEGAGKSVLAQQIAAFLDKDRVLDPHTQLCWTPDAFAKAVGTLEKGKAIVWDEARRGANRRRSGQEINLKITDMLAECRQHNLFLVIVMPSFYDMDMNIAVWRTRWLVHVSYHWELEDEKHPLKRGDFRFYNENGKKNLYTDRELRRGYKYPYMPNESFDGTFINHYVVDEELYKRLKYESDLAVNATKKENDITDDTPATNHARIMERGRLLLILSKKKGLRPKYREILSTAYEVIPDSVSAWMMRFKKEESHKISDKLKDYLGIE